MQQKNKERNIGQTKMEKELRPKSFKKQSIPSFFYPGENLKRQIL